MTGCQDGRDPTPEALSTEMSPRRSQSGQSPNQVDWSEVFAPPFAEDRQGFGKYSFLLLQGHELFYSMPGTKFFVLQFSELNKNGFGPACFAGLYAYLNRIFGQLNIPPLEIGIFVKNPLLSTKELPKSEAAPKGY